MKKIFTLLFAATFSLSLNAQFVDLNLEIWKGVFAAGDIDNDGDLDVIVSGSKGSTENGAILINDGAGNLTKQTGDRVITVGNGGNIQFGDIDGDGDLDVIFCGWGCTNEVKAGIALNDGNGVFTLAPASAYPILDPVYEGTAEHDITSCGFADFDLNGLLDYYFFAEGKGNCVIYFQQPDGSFVADNSALKATERWGANTGAPIDYNFVEPEVFVLDFDNDGYPDMWINAADLNSANSGEQTQRFSYLFRNDGFGVLTQYSGAVVQYKKANGDSQWADFNGDGILDMLIHGDGYLNSGEESDIIYRIFQNNGTAISKAWEQSVARQGSFGHGSIIVDWNNDGFLDVFGGGWKASANAQVTELYLGNSPFTFTQSTESFQGASEQGLLVADLNGDYKVDLLLNGYCGDPLQKNAAGFHINTSPTASTLPSAPTGLNATITSGSGETMVEFTWSTAASDVGKNGLSYNLALKNKTTGKWLYNPLSVVGGAKDGWRKVAQQLGNVFTNKRYELYNLPDGEYEWSVQTINGAYFGGPFAETKTFTIGSSGIQVFKPYKPAVTGSKQSLSVNGEDAVAQSLKVYNSAGQLAASKTFSGKTSIDLPTGIYVVVVEKADAIPFRTKVLVK